MMSHYVQPNYLDTKKKNDIILTTHIINNNYNVN